MKTVLIFLLFFLFSSCGQSQLQNQVTKLAGGPCEGCEAIFEYGNRALTPADTLPDFFGPGKKIKLTGTIYLPDGKTPAKDVILYIYHTDQDGVYPTKGGETGWDRRHGYIRGWIKTGKDGKYTFYTMQPGVYPNRMAAAHIHVTVLEPSGKYYWIEDYYFKDDPLLTTKETAPQSPRGGTPGVLTLIKTKGMETGTRDLILGKHITGYE